MMAVAVVAVALIWGYVIGGLLILAFTDRFGRFRFRQQLDIAVLQQSMRGFYTYQGRWADPIDETHFRPGGGP